MIRTLIVFLAALLLGALTVSGQERPEDELRRRIRELTELLKKRADQRAPEDAAARAVLRMYDVSDLILPIRSDSEPAGVYLLPSKFAPPETAEWFEPMAGFEMDSLIDFLRQVIEPETWETVENADVQLRSGTLFVNNVPRVQKKIASTLATLRGWVERSLEVEITAVPLQAGEEALIFNRPRELTDAEANAMLEREPLGSALLRCRSGQRVGQRIGREVGYLQDYDVEIAQEAAIGDPIARTVFEGCSVHLIAMLDDAAAGARLDLELDQSAVPRPIRTMKTEHGPVELPAMNLTRVRTALWVPLDKTVVLGGATTGEAPCLFLARVTRAASK